MATPKDMASAMKENSLADAICDIGYAFTASVEECKNNILNFGTRDLKAADVARIVSVMIKYRADSPDGPQIQTPGNFWISRNKKDGKVLDTGKWNVEIFIQTLKDLVPTLNWKEVILQLDHQEFLVPDREALNILFSIIRTGLRNSGYPPNGFPFEYICRRWTNMDGQMSLIINILKNPDIFSFADHPLHQVPIDLLKSSPEIDSKEVGTWRNMYLVELLLYASEHGYYAQVSELFKIPLQHCPDVLFLVLLQISPPLTPMRQELFTMLIPIFLVNHPNSAIILYHAWHDQNLNVKPIIMHVMADWYLLGECDHSKLSRILDIAQDLKALSLLLNMQSFPFVIDLACLASRREYLKLDKWLMDKIRDHGEAFIAAMVHFLQRRRPIILSNNRSEEQLPKASQLPHETITTMLACMELCLPNVREELQEAIYNIISDWQSLMRSKSRPISTRDVTFEPPGLASQMINSHIDPIAMLTPNMATMSLGVPANSALAMPGNLGPLMATQGSPSRIMGAGPNSPFAMVPMQQNTNMGNIGSLPGMIPTPGHLDKSRIQESLLYPDSVPVTKDIEDEANVYFKRIYNHPANPSLTIEEALDMLKKLQDSPIKRERELFSCMLQNLFEEYKFFPQYPYKELHITSQLFGGIIEKGLVPSYVSLGLAMGLVLDALKKGENSKMYYFGIAALDRFKTRLKDYHKYCEYIKAIPYFKKFPPHITEYVEYGLQSQDPPTKPQGSLLAAVTLNTVPNPNPTVPVTATYRSASYTPTISKSNAAGSANSRPSIANITNIDTLLTASDESDKITPPPETIQDKAAFIFNNLSQLNLESKCQDLKKIITEEHFPWLSQYLVMKRVSIEFNFHTLYANFLDVFKVREVNILVTRETYRNIKVLLRSDKVIANFTDRSLLKNLGHWLGMITLARNQPILHVDIDLKTLLLEAYHKGRQDLLFIVPFVAKILESCSKSVVFKPPNPWTMALMSVLAELHQEANLELNLKFEVEVLCKNLSLDVNDLKPVLFLKDPQKMRTTKLQMGQSKEQQQEPAASAPTNQPIGHQNQPIVQQNQPIAQQNQPMTHQNQSMTQQNQSMTQQNQSLTLQNQPMAHQMQMVPTTTHTAELDEVALPNPVVTSASVTEIVGHPEPRFSYFDVNITSASFEQKIFINPSILLLQSYPHLTQFIKPAIERSIQEWIHPVVDRAIKYALTTCEHLIRKDFALDPDETRVRTCAHHMMRNLTAGIAMITCRDQIVITITTNLKTAFNAALMPTTPHQEGIEKAASSVAADNMELACAFIQKTAVEKALPELDKRLSADFEVRKQARQEGRRYYDPVELAYQNEMIPERCRLRAGAPSDVQLAVYERFACKIPGFAQVQDVTLFTPKPLTQEAQAPQASNFTQVTSPTHEELSALIAAAEMFISNCFGNTVLAPLGSNMHLLLEGLCAARRNFDISAASTLLQKAVEGVLDVNQALSTANPLEMTRYRDTHLRVLKLLEGVYGHTWTAKQITNRLVECRDEIRYNVEAVDVLIRSRFVNLPQYDHAMAHMMDNGNNFPAVSFAMQLVQLHLSGDRTGFLTESDLVHTTEMLARVVTHHRQPPDLLVQPARVDIDPNGDLGERSLGPTAYIQSGIMQVRSRNYDDPPGLKDKAELFLREWKNMLLSPITELTLQQNFNGYMHRMNMTGIILSNDMLTRFLRISTGLCIENVYQALSEDRMSPRQGPANREKYYAMCDSFVKLVSLLIKNTERGNLAQKLILLNKVLGMIAGYLLRDQEERGTKFHQLPYHRLLLMLLLDVTLAEPTQEALNYQVMAAFCQTLHLIRPACAAGFAYAWLEIVAHRVFIDRVLATAHTQQGWGMYSTLLIDLFKFLDPFLRTTELAPPTLTLYKGTLKVLLVLLHDFPEFLCDYHYGFCDVIPPNCIQMRNLILSAFPRNMKLPDPFTPNLKVDLLPEISLPPRAVINYARVLPSSQFKTDLDAYLQARAPVTFLSELRSYMQVLNDPARRYNSQLMNAVVLYVGTQAIASIRAKGNIPSMATIAHSAHMDIFQSFAVDFDDEGRYLFLNAVANQLRYPNSHTHYFSCVLLHLFAEANSEAIQIQITRMLLERLIANRPHPWGLLITFIELIKNPVYKFWQREFVNSPDIDNYDNKLPPLYNYIVEQVICRISGRKDRNQEEKENSV